MADYTELLGFLAGTIVMASLIPQVYKSWKTKSTHDISMIWTTVYTTGLILYVVYGYLIASRPLMIMGFVEMLLAASLLVLKHKYG